jgi:hypothetical protein
VLVTPHPVQRLRCVISTMMITVSPKPPPCHGTTKYGMGPHGFRARQHRAADRTKRQCQSQWHVLTELAAAVHSVTTWDRQQLMLVVRKLSPVPLPAFWQKCRVCQ